MHSRSDLIVCSVTGQIFNEPVIVGPSGYTYEWEAIDKIIKDAKAQGMPALCPLSRMPIIGYVKSFKDIALVEKYLTKHPEAKKDQYVKTKSEQVPSTPVSIDSIQVAVNAPAARPVENTISEDDRVAINAAQEELNRQQPTQQRVLTLEDLQRMAALGTRFRDAAQRGNNPERAQQIERERILLQAEWARRNEEHERQEREAREAARARAREAERARQREREAALAAQRERESRLVTLFGAEETSRAKMIGDIQNIIWALKFEEGPRPRSPFPDRLDLIVINLFASALQSPLPWQKITVKEGPRNVEAMHNVLKAAILALKELNPDALHAEKVKYKGQYDCVATWLGGEKSLADGGYASFASAMGTITNQPGYLIHEVLQRTEQLLIELCEKNPHKVHHVEPMRARMR